MISWEELVLRLVVAAVLGGLVGLERERLEWAAGMRTHALVSLGSALFMVVSIFGFSDILNEQHVILDPSRVAAQVAAGPAPNRADRCGLADRSAHVCRHRWTRQRNQRGYSRQSGPAREMVGFCTTLTE